jgi:hypothetical protein
LRETETVSEPTLFETWVEVEDSGQDTLGLLDTCPKIDAGLRESGGLRSGSTAIALCARRQAL